MGSQINEALVLLGMEPIAWPDPAYWIAIVLFSVIGMVLLFLARRRKKRLVMWVSVALMLYPYIVWGTIPVWIVGILLSGLAAWCWRQPGQDDSTRNS
jgi:Ca2+/Na+ antiporter